MDNKKKTNWNIPVPRILDDALEEAVVKDTHSTKSDFVRDAVRHKLEEIGFKPEPVFGKKLQE
jgi:Arc/MetJ-type ribon-helix-helix transcriptional regulator